MSESGGRLLSVPRVPRVPGRALRALLAAGLAAYGAILSFRVLGRERIGGIDDADIFLTYGRNLARGHGWVYTPGFEAVEGTTSFLWTVAAAGAWLVTDRPEWVLTGLSLILAAGTSWLVLEVSARVEGEEGGAPVTWLAVLWLALQPAFFAWTTLTLMDSALWSFGIAALVAALAADVGVLGDGAAVGEGMARGARLAGIGAAALLALTRPEAVVLVPAVLAAAALCRPGPLLAGARRYLAPAVAWLGAEAALLVFRLRAFGQPWPNTYYAKVPDDRRANVVTGARYVESWIRAEPVGAAALAVTLGVGAWFLVRRARGPRPGPAAPLRVAFLAAGTVAAGFALPLAGGGDHFGSHRFLQPFVPWLAVPAGYAADRAARRWGGTLRARAARISGAVDGGRAAFLPGGPAGRALVAVGLVGVLGGLGLVRWRQFRLEARIQHEFEISIRGRTIGRALGEAFPSGARPTVGGVTVGGLGLAYPGRVLDLLGLNWPAMAHAPGPVRGLRGHSAFAPGPFWERRPRLVSPRLLPPPRTEASPGAREPSGAAGRGPVAFDAEACRLGIAADAAFLDSLPHGPRFREAYAPAAIPADSGAIHAWALRTWAGETSARSPGVAVAPWARVCEADAYGRPGEASP